MEDEARKNPWDRSLHGINGFMEGIARRLPVYRSLRQAFGGESGDIVNWDQARQIAVLVAQSEGSAGPPPDEIVKGSFEAMLRRSEGLVREYSHLDTQEAIGPLLVFDRPDWIETNPGTL